MLKFCLIEFLLFQIIYFLFFNFDKAYQEIISGREKRRDNTLVKVFKERDWKFFYQRQKIQKYMNLKKCLFEKNV